METNKNYKRKYRQLDDDVKARIAASLKNRGKSLAHRNAISQSMVNYWKTVENKPSDDTPSSTETGQIV